MVDCLLTPQSLSRDCCHCLSTCTAPGLAPVSYWHISTCLCFHQFTGWSSHSSLISSHNQPCKSEFKRAGPLCWGNIYPAGFFFSVCGSSPSISCDNSLWQALVTFTRIYALFLYYTSLEFEPIYFCICIKGCFTCMLACFHMCEYTCLSVQVRVHKCTCLKA